MEVLYEDNHVIIVNKTCSEIVQGDKTGDTPLSEEKYDKPGNVFVGVTHRLDRPVSGVVVFAKTSKALARLNEMFRNGEVKKRYWAIVKQAPEKESDELVHYLVRNEKSNKSVAYDREKPGAKRAVLDYRRPLYVVGSRFENGASSSNPLPAFQDRFAYQGRFEIWGRTFQSRRRHIAARPSCRVCPPCIERTYQCDGSCPRR